MTGLRVRRARPDERLALEALQRRSSMALPEYRDALLAHPGAVVLPAEQIARGEVIVAELGGRIAGFAVIVEGDSKAELDGLFVEPELWRKGIGSALVEDAVHQARRRGFSLVTVVAGPSSKQFYESCGFKVEGEAETRFGPALRMSR